MILSGALTNSIISADQLRRTGSHNAGSSNQFKLSEMGPMVKITEMASGEGSSSTSSAHTLSDYSDSEHDLDRDAKFIKNSARKLHRSQTVQ